MTQVTRHSQHGFTLIELIMVIVILGVVGGMVAVFMRGPIDAYIAGGQRATLTDVADTTVRRISRDLRTALPNSIRTPTNQCIEFIPTKTGGRYRTEDTGSGNNLDFAIADGTFNMLGNNGALPAEQRIVAGAAGVGDVVVVYNLGIAGADAYANNNTARVTAIANGAETAITIIPTLFPLASGSNRFQVIPAGEPVVGYICSGTTLLRYVRALPYPLPTPPVCPTAAAVAGSPILARNVGACNFVVGAVNLQRNSLVTLSLQLTEAGETVTLQNEVHVSNTP